MELSPLIRLNKHLALQLGISRREADDLIASGKVSVNGQTATLGTRVHQSDTITVSDKPITVNAKYLYLALNKPTGYVCSRKPQGKSPTIYSLLPSKYAHLKSVGRLDKDSSGLILLTNDGDFAYRMTHPRFRKVKIYEIQLDQSLQPLHRQMVSDFGIDLPDGHSQLTLERQHDGDDRHWIVQMSEGRNRQIRRTFAALGYTVTKLHRTNFGNYTLGDIKSGQWREQEALR